jgi:hypothetical protein
LVKKGPQSLEREESYRGVSLIRRPAGGFTPKILREDPS